PLVAWSPSDMPPLAMPMSRILPTPRQTGNKVSIRIPCSCIPANCTPTGEIPMKLRTLTMVILVTASFGHTPTRAAAANLELAEAAFREGNHSEIVKRLLPSWKRGELTDPRGLYLLS